MWGADRRQKEVEDLSAVAARMCAPDWLRHYEAAAPVRDGHAAAMTYMKESVPPGAAV